MSHLPAIVSHERLSTPLSCVLPSVAVQGLTSTVRRSIPPPSWSSYLHLSLRRLIPRRSIRCFRLRSLLQYLPLRNTLPLILCFLPHHVVPVSLSPGLSSPPSPSSSSPTPARRSSSLLRSCSYPLLRRFPPPPSLGLLWPLAPPRAPLPPAPATNIARKDKYVGDGAGGVEARWSLAGGSAPHWKCPRRTLAVVGDGISCPRFLHHPQ